MKKSQMAKSQVTKQPLQQALDLSDLDSDVLAKVQKEGIGNYSGVFKPLFDFLVEHHLSIDACHQLKSTIKDKMVLQANDVEETDGKRAANKGKVKAKSMMLLGALSNEIDSLIKVPLNEKAYNEIKSSVKASLITHLIVRA